jgi:hypothetical protein
MVVEYPADKVSDGQRRAYAMAKANAHSGAVAELWFRELARLMGFSHLLVD